MTTQGLSIEESVVRAMDGTDPGIYPFLPYILQDIWEIGTDPAMVIRLMRAHFGDCTGLQVLDLGCGKGAVSVRLASRLGCRCHGIDAVPEFIRIAREKAAEYGVSSLCRFEVGDIREQVHGLPPSDAIILGAIGPVLGDWRQSLRSLSGILAPGGVIIADDGFIEDGSDFSHPLILKKGELLEQIDQAGMRMSESLTVERERILRDEAKIFTSLHRRCLELAARHADKAGLFHDYIRNQEKEGQVNADRITCAVLAIVKNQHSNP
jgi:SAM-dependent methyltransferase